MLAVKDLVVDIDGSHILRGVSLEVRRRRARLPGRPQRRRQVDHVPHHHRRAQGGLRHHRARGPRHHGARALRDRAPGRRLRARGERGVRRSDRRREHPAADLDAGNGALGRGARGPGLPRLSQARALSRARRPAAVGRRAQDGVDRPRLGARPQAAAAGRADGGPLAGHRAGDRRRHRLHPPARPRRAHRRIRTCTTCPTSPTASTSSSAARSSMPARRPTCARTRPWPRWWMGRAEANA